MKGSLLIELPTPEIWAHRGIGHPSPAESDVLSLSPPFLFLLSFLFSFFLTEAVFDDPKTRSRIFDRFCRIFNCPIKYENIL